MLRNKYGLEVCLIDIIIENMQAHNIDSLVAIEEASFSRPWSKAGFEAELNNGTAVFLVASVKGKTVGYIGFHVIVDEGYVANIAVSPEYRRMGIASALLRRTVETAYERNVAFLTLEVRKSNENAISLYRKFGFEIVGVRKNFYSAPTEDAFIMTKQFDVNNPK